MKQCRGWSVQSALAAVMLAGCASPGLPPGGPERHVPPVIIRTEPDTNAAGVRGNEFVAHFDEVVSEHPANASSLNDIVLISPRHGAPEVSWHRSSLSVRPSKGWLPNTTYTVTILPGITDLRGNVSTTATVVTFSTGRTIPHTDIRGTLFDWVTGLPANSGMIEASPVTDTSIAYLAASDSIGHYRMVGLPPAQYRVRGYLDQNRNRALDPSEAFDTSRVYLTDSLNLELLAFAHDSVGPRLGSVAPVDSVTLRAIFDTPLDPRVPLTPAEFTLTGPDSARIAIVSASAVQQDTALAPPPIRPVSQSAIPIPQKRARTPRVLPKPTRPLLIRDVLIVIARPLHAGSTYRLSALNATGPTGKKLSSDRSFQAPALTPPMPRDSAPKSTKPAIPVKPAPADSARPRRPAPPAKPVRPG